MLSKELEQILNQAFQHARDLKHEYLTVEHLLSALLGNADIEKILKACGANLSELKNILNTFIDQSTPEITEDIKDTQPTLEFQRVLQRAVFHVQSSGRGKVQCSNVLVAIFSEQDSHALSFLKQQNVTRFDVVNYLSHLVSNDNNNESAQQNILNAPTDEQKEKMPLELYAVNLNQRAKEGKIDRLIGRDYEVERVTQILCRRRKNNPLLVGEAGVGKTAIAEGLAKKIVDKQVPDVLTNGVIYSLDMGTLLAGTKYRGDFEKRFKEVLKQLQEEEGAILFIDEIHTMVGVGTASGGVMDASNLIKPVLTSGDLKCIGSTTYQEYRTIFEKDHALARRFQKVDVEEPTIEQTFKILKGLKPYFEDHYNIKYTLPALQAAAELSAKYITERFLPDKAIDVIDELGAYQRTSSNSKKKKLINIIDVENMVARLARIPAKTVSASDKSSMENLSQDLKMLVYGQDEVIKEMVDTIKLARAGLRDPNKPWGSFLFSGPTGVGKTEVTQQLANLLGIELLRFDMSEYMEKHTVSRLIGSPPGYVGYEEGGLLTEAVIKHPYSVVLLDEIEKVHPDICNLLLQVMDHGTLTDNNGRKADFRNIILIMTTNAGAFESQKNSIGFAKQESEPNSMDALKRIFAPEFRNRLDAVMQFASLSKENVKSIVDKFLGQLQGQLDQCGVLLEVDENTKEWLSENGYDEKMGARAMARLIQESIKKPLAEEILFGKLASGGRAELTMKNNKLAFNYI